MSKIANIDLITGDGTVSVPVNVTPVHDQDGYIIQLRATDVGKTAYGLVNSYGDIATVALTKTNKFGVWRMPLKLDTLAPQDAWRVVDANEWAKNALKFMRDQKSARKKISEIAAYIPKGILEDGFPRMWFRQHLMKLRNARGGEFSVSFVDGKNNVHVSHFFQGKPWEQGAHVAQWVLSIIGEDEPLGFGAIHIPDEHEIAAFVEMQTHPAYAMF